ncbi:MAG TPA: DNA mismatch repair protein MutS [Vicinamibacterales bacterium]|nr:DNA mismatch repair protein MutS [Vicinamibacterales bacterium]
MTTPASPSTFNSPGAAPTPAMRQYLDVKRQHRDAIVLFRMGDFYEMFYEDALAASRVLELTLTSRAKDAGGAAIPMCGIPFHALDTYLPRLVRKGYRAAICEQVEDPKKAKGIVKREVTRVVSPGTFTDAGYLEAREPAFLAALAPHGDAWGLAFLDVSTGQFAAAEFRGPGAREAVGAELAVIRPKELLLGDGVSADGMLPAFNPPRITVVDGWLFEPARARATLCEQLRTASLAGHGLEPFAAAVAAAGALVTHLRDTQRSELTHIRDVALRVTADALLIDPVTLRHLNVVEGVDGGREGSLLAELDRTITSMGGRLLRQWLVRPLVALARIQDRLDAVEDCAFRATERGRVRDALKHVHDLERLVARVSLGTANPRDLVAIGQTLAVVPRLRALAADLQAPLLRSVVAEIDDLAEIRTAIEGTLVDEPPVVTRDGGLIRDGVDPELDGLRAISRGGKSAIVAMEESEKGRTGIASLKVRYNRVFGYYIEISKSNLGAVPADYIRKQTIAGGERYITPALKEYEDKVLGAEERITVRELELFEALRVRVAAAAGPLLDTARGVATLDVIAALADAAAVCNYTKPLVHDGDEFVAVDARHPVVERHVSAAFVPNDVHLDSSTRQVVILTGPNMGGKSTYLRQVALLALMAQAGSFVPAKTAKVAIVDRIYARVGASDNIAKGQSTFMVEMQETATILHTATNRSLVILDEIGRGTATFDGLSLAWAVAEHLASNPTARPKTIFATHYHELTDLADALAGVVNSHVTAREFKDEIVFLHKIVDGRSDRSYGIQVARLAGLPPAVVRRASEILKSLEQDELTRGGRPSLSGAPAANQRQLALFQTAAADHPVVDRLRGLDLDRLTPIEALNLLAALKRETEA